MIALQFSNGDTELWTGIPDAFERAESVLMELASRGQYDTILLFENPDPDAFAHATLDLTAEVPTFLPHVDLGYPDTLAEAAISVEGGVYVNWEQA